MSAGAFSSSKYESDSDVVYRIRVQPETIALTIGTTPNDPPAGAVTGAVSVRVGGGNREYGIKARAVTLRWTATVPTGYKPDEILRVPILKKSLYSSISPGSAGDYLGQPVEVVGKLPERVR